MSAVGYDLKFTGEAIWKVLVAGLILGAGLPAVFAGGIRALAWGSGGDAEVGGGRPNVLGKVIAGILFLIVVYCIAAGIVYIVATGKGSDYDITFKHVIPEIYNKG
jgi:hypothetical protein